MSELDPTIVLSLGVVTLFGTALTFGAYLLQRLLLAWVGWIAGGIAGVAGGWFVVPQITPVTVGEQLAAAVILGIVGIVIGRRLLRTIARFGVAILTFLAGTIATLVVTIGDEVLEMLTVPAEANRSQIEQVLEDLANLPLLEEPELQQWLLVALVVGGVMAILALRLYRQMLTVALTGVGAAVLSFTVPVWQGVIEETTVVAEQAEVSMVWFVGFLIIGLAAQFFRIRSG